MMKFDLLKKKVFELEKDYYITTRETKIKVENMEDNVYR